MTQTSISRRRPCRRCGGRYFAGTMSVWATLVAVVAMLGGIAMTVGGGSLAGLFGGDDGADASAFTDNVAWLAAGFVVAAIAAVVGHGNRCIQCDSQQ